MKLSRRKFLHLAASAAVLPAISHIAVAQDYPTRPIRLVVPFPPGGAFDALGRPWAEKMKPLLGAVFVENIGGSGASLGAAAVARARPDGYTILLGGTLPHVNEALLKNRPLYDPVKDLDPIVAVAANFIGIAVNPSVPAQTLGEFITYAKANPGKLSYGSAGTGTMSNLSGELFKQLTGLNDLVHIPYKGAGPGITDLVSGHIPMMTPNVTGQVLEFHRAGKIRILAVNGAQRLGAAPDIPTAIEQGVPGMIGLLFLGLFAPAATPKPIVDRIAEATHAAMADADFQKVLTAAGLEPVADSNSEKAKRFMDEEIARWGPVVKASGFKVE
jgi:tripartite-type tricarboxylate transporter receptor subunit TctC